MHARATGVEHRGRYLRVDCRGADTGLWMERCRAFADVSLARDVTRVLIDATDCAAEGQRALRDALTQLVLAGIADGLRLALVTNVPALRASFATLERDLVVLDMRARLFAQEEPALEWLLARNGGRAAEGAGGAA
jgi:hypothetical protein